MAGGTFDKNVGKVRPGTYINFEGSGNEAVGNGSRGIVVMPLIGHSYGPEKEFITIPAAAPDIEHAKLGFSVYDDDPSMLLIREALKCAETVIVYIPKAGTKATGTGGGVTGTAKYGGTRGNKLAFAITANAVSGFDITINLDGVMVSKYEGVANLAAAVAIEDPYIDFAAAANDAVLAAVAGVTLASGTDGTAANTDITGFLDAIEGVQFNALAFPSSDSSLKAAVKTKIKYLREGTGKQVVGVVADYAADYPGIINVTNSVVLADGTTLTNIQATAWVAGASAGATYAESNTYKEYVGAAKINGVKTHEQAVAAINNGEFFFSYSEQGRVVVEYDINSLTTFTDKIPKSYRKNKVIRVLDTFADAVIANFPPNKFPNTPEGWDVMEGIGRSILKLFENDGAIKNVDYENDFVVDREASKDDETYFNIGLEPVDSSEKCYFAVKTR